MARVLLEVCVDGPEGLREAVAGGADRIELCSALDLGGLTPSAGLMQLAAACGVPCLAMIRLRAGGFVFSAAEVDVMRTDIRAAREAGLAGVVLGASLPDGRLDAGMLATLLADARGMDTTLHRAIDLCPDLLEAVDLAISLGFRRILSSGGAKVAAQGAGPLGLMMARAGGACIIMPGSGISPETLARLRSLPLREVHASCSVPREQDQRALDFGFQSGTARRTDRAKVSALKAALAARLND